ncbi:VOC family protein [Variovorax paradoxus]|uniref:Metallothiol transferase FosB n=1 Tax=Variovorax paradoxus TaxID=34073 RepID=A0A0H2LRB1_VARPD|nr:VOC family protein [Variovorax paradoxus]KLN52784.1 metallothiol transferase FosB [Variovorax paradoxus]
MTDMTSALPKAPGSTLSMSRRPNPGLTPMMLNHAAWVTPDAAATAEFYTRIMGMDLVSTVIEDTSPSTGLKIPYFHLFFRMADGSTLAFFEAPGVPPPAKSSHIAYDVFTHVALQAADRNEVMRWSDWLKSNGLEVQGPTDHKGMILSIYFTDPAGLRMEITTPLDKNWNRHDAKAKADLDLWVQTKNKALQEGRDVVEALTNLCVEVRQRYDCDTQVADHRASA